MSKAPQLVVLAGPNGAGKSTSAPSLIAETLGIADFVNADVIVVTAFLKRRFVAAIRPVWSISFVSTRRLRIHGRCIMLRWRRSRSSQVKTKLSVGSSTIERRGTRPGKRETNEHSKQRRYRGCRYRPNGRLKCAESSFERSPPSPQAPRSADCDLARRKGRCNSSR